MLWVLVICKESYILICKIEWFVSVLKEIQIFFHSLYWFQPVLANTLFLTDAEPVGFDNVWWRKTFWNKKDTIWIIHSIIIDYTFLYIMLSSRLTSDGNILILYSWFLYMYIELGIFKPRFSNDSFIVTCIAYNNGNIACCWWSSSSWRFIMFILYVYIHAVFLK